jgi:hypothetical protein
VKLLETAVPVHRSNTDPDLIFDVLNYAVREGIGNGSPDSEHYDFDEDEDAVAALVLLCSESGLESVDFGPYNAPGQQPFAASTVLDVSDQIRVTVWSDDAGTQWVDVAGHVQRADAPKLAVPAEDQDEAEMVANSPRSWPPSTTSLKPSSWTWTPATRTRLSSCSTRSPTSP